MDYTRDGDLEELYNARESAGSTEEAEKIDKIMHDIKEQDDEELNDERKELVGAVRTKDGRTAKRLSERIKIMSHKKGMEHNG